MIRGGEESPDVSVVLTCYNQEEYVANAIESVLSQSLESLELIVCDDASTDNSWEIIETFRRESPSRVKTIRQVHNVGVAANRNTGFRQTAGSYVTPLSADDAFFPKKLERELKALQDKPTAAWAFSRCQTIDPGGHPQGEFWGTVRGRGGRLFGAVARRDISPRYMLIRKGALLDVGLPVETLTLYEDWDFKLRLSLHYDAVFVDEVLSSYRIHESGLHRSGSLEHAESMQVVVNRAADAFKRLKISNRRTLLVAMERFALEQWVRYGRESNSRLLAFRKLGRTISKGRGGTWVFRLLLKLLVPQWMLDRFRS